MKPTALVIVFWLASCAVAAAAARPATLKVTHSHLIATCFADQPVSGGTRAWTATEPVAVTVTMRNAPRSGVANRDPGIARIAFTPIADHEYEIEVRADAIAFSTRVWPRGEWTPVVRDRTTDRVVSSEPIWIEKGCR